MQKSDWVTDLFDSIDHQDTGRFAAFLAEDVQFRFGNAPAVHGKSDVTAMVRSFFDSIKGVQHEVTRSWYEQDTVISHGMVSYTRHDDTVLSVPFANILRTRDDLIDEYSIYVDISALY